MRWKTLLYDWIQRVLVKAMLVITLTLTFALLPLYYQIITTRTKFALLPAWIPDLPGWAWLVLPHATPVLLAFAWFCWFKGDHAANGARRARRRAELGLR